MGGSKIDAPVTIATVGGEGTRLYPLTLSQPKPLLSMCGEAILARALETLALQGCRKFILASKGVDNTTRLKEYFKRGEGFSRRLRLRPDASFMYQPNYLDHGNGDAVRFCMEFFDIDTDVLVVSGDNVIDIDIPGLMDFHRRNRNLLTVVLKELEGDEEITQFGIAEVNKEMRIKGFHEKPSKPQSRYINTSIYLFSPDIRYVFREMGERVRDIGKDVIPYLTEKGYPVFGYMCEGYWADVGRPELFLKTTLDILEGKLRRIRVGTRQTTLSRLFGSTSAIEKRQVIHPSTLKAVARGVDIGRNVMIGADCKIGKGVEVENSFIGDSCILGERSTIMNSVVMDFTNISSEVRLNNCIVGRYSTIEEKSVIDGEMSVDVVMGNPDLIPVLGEGVTIVKGSVIGPKKRVARIQESHRLLSTGRFIELGYDRNNIYFIER
ncbi:MAG: sugar phosphate nucleotidyltransferase [Candidatus Hydrothermarchaeaceae archaeon]